MHGSLSLIALLIGGLPSLLYTKYQISYLLSLYLNNQLLNITILLVISYSFKKKISLLPWVTLFSYIVYLSLPTPLLLKIETWPSSLLIGLNTIHPLLYYWGFLNLIFLSWKFFFIKIHWRLNTIVSVIGVAFLLGMYWGCLNDVWGFFELMI